MKRTASLTRLPRWICAVSFALALAACGGGGDDEPRAETTDATALPAVQGAQR